MKRQENRAVLAWRRAVSTGLVSTADWAYMKAPVPRPTLRLVDNVSRSCGHTPGKVAEQGGQSLKVLDRPLSEFRSVFLKIEMGGKLF